MAHVLTADPTDGGMRVHVVNGAGGSSALVVTISPSAAPATPGNTALITVTNLIPVAVIAAINTGVVTVREDASVISWPTTNFLILRPNNSSTAITQPIGSAYTFSAPPGTQFTAGQTVGYIQLPAAVSASTTVQVDCQ